MNDDGFLNDFKDQNQNYQANPFVSTPQQIKQSPPKESFAPREDAEFFQKANKFSDGSDQKNDDPPFLIQNQRAKGIQPKQTPNQKKKGCQKNQNNSDPDVRFGGSYFNDFSNVTQDLQ